jgi:hypothetical protein
MPSVGVDLGEADHVLIELIDLAALQLGNLVVEDDAPIKMSFFI